MNLGTKYSAHIRVGFFFPLGDFLAGLKNKKDDSGQTYRFQSIIFDEAMELVQVVAKHLECEYDVFGDVNAAENEEKYVGFCLPGSSKFNVNTTLHFGATAFGPDLRLAYVTENMDKITSIQKGLEDIGLHAVPTIFLSWQVDDKDVHPARR